MPASDDVVLVAEESRIALTSPDVMGPQRAGALMVPIPIAEVFTIAARQERSGNLAEADRLLGYVLAVAPKQPDALHMAGIVAFRLGRQEEGLAKIEQAIVLGIDIALYLRNVCEIYRTLNRLDEAVAAAKRAVGLAPHDPLCLHNLAVNLGWLAWPILAKRAWWFS